MNSYRPGGSLLVSELLGRPKAVECQHGLTVVLRQIVEINYLTYRLPPVSCKMPTVTHSRAYRTVICLAKIVKTLTNCAMSSRNKYSQLLFCIKLVYWIHFNSVHQWIHFLRRCLIDPKTSALNERVNIQLFNEKTSPTSFCWISGDAKMLVFFS